MFYNVVGDWEGPRGVWWCYLMILITLSQVVFGSWGAHYGGFFFGFGTLSEQHILHKGPPGSAVGPGGQNIDLDVVGSKGAVIFFMD